MKKALAAQFSEDRLYRYSLTREIETRQDLAPRSSAEGGFASWKPIPTANPVVTFVGLNPSTADETADDPTIRRCIGFARSWGYARLKMLNLFAYRSTDPLVMWAKHREGVDIVGPENMQTIEAVVGSSDLVVLAWGALPSWTHAQAVRVAELVELPHCLGLTKGGAPRHPLYMKADTQPVLFAPCPVNLD